MMNAPHMNHSMMDPAHMNHSMMNAAHVNHSMVGHSNMTHTSADHSNMNHSMTGHNHHNMDGMDGHDHSVGGMHDMKMYFHEGYKEYILFQDCHTNSTEAMIGACFVIFAVAVLYEGLKVFREYLLQRQLVPTQSGAVYVEKQMSGTSQEQMVMQTKSKPMSRRMLSSGHMIQTVLHVLQVFISYCLMLVFMTYNIWLCLAIVLGAGAGYFLFGWKRAVVVDANEHCH